MIIQCVVCDHCRTMIPLITGDEQFFRIASGMSNKRSEPLNMTGKEFSFCNKDCYVEFVKNHMTPSGGWDKEIKDAEAKNDEELSNELKKALQDFQGKFVINPNQITYPTLPPNPWPHQQVLPYKQTQTGDEIWIDDTSTKIFCSDGSGEVVVKDVRLT